MVMQRSFSGSDAAIGGELQLQGSLHCRPDGQARGESVFRCGVRLAFRPAGHHLAGQTMWVAGQIRADALVINVNIARCLVP